MVEDSKIQFHIMSNNLLLTKKFLHLQAVHKEGVKKGGIQKVAKKLDMLEAYEMDNCLQCRGSCSWLSIS